MRIGAVEDDEVGVIDRELRGAIAHDEDDLGCAVPIEIVGEDLLDAIGREQLLLRRGRHTRARRIGEA